MKYFNGFPADNGATDWMDSPRLAAILALFDSPDTISMKLYLDYNTDKPVRCPGLHNDLVDFSRDQLVPYMAAMHKQGYYIRNRLIYEIIKQNYYRAPNGDILFTPSVLNHIRTCCNYPTNLLGDLWLRLDMYWQQFSSTWQKNVEPNQLLCMVIIANKQQLYKRIVKDWKYLVINYWCGWRNEVEIADLITKGMENE